MKPATVDNRQDEGKKSKMQKRRSNKTILTVAFYHSIDARQ
jgi:hypothetical protein